MGRKPLKATVNQLRRNLRAVLEASREQRRTIGRSGNTVIRKNVVVGKNVGRRDAAHVAVAAQSAPIRQKGSESG
jgi:hypothetical protein